MSTCDGMGKPPHTLLMVPIALEVRLDPTLLVILGSPLKPNLGLLCGLKLSIALGKKVAKQMSK